MPIKATPATRQPRTPSGQPYRQRLLTDAQRAYCAQRALGKGRIHYKWDKLPRVQQYIAELQARTQSLAVYDCTQAMRSVDKAIDFAYDKGNSMAVMKGLELKAKLAGLLIERIQVESVDLTAALEAARARAHARIVNIPQESTLRSIANDPVASITVTTPVSTPSTTDPTGCE